MYSKELESLIEDILADDVITDKEMAVLRKRAEAEGVDPDEIEVVIEGRLVTKKNKQKAAAPAAAKPANNKQGGIVKCPSCGAPVPPLATKCEDCGYEFRNVSAVNSAQALFDALQDMDRRRVDTLRSGNVRANDVDKQFLREKLTLIRTFPVPNSKEDLLEMLSMASSNAYDNDGVVGQEEEAWLQKTDQIYTKVVTVSKADPETLKRATSLVTSLMRRLPQKYKEFTHIPTSMREHAQQELKEANAQTKKWQDEKIKELAKSSLGILGPCTLLLGIILLIIGGVANIETLVMIGLVGAVVGYIYSKKFWKKYKEIKNSNGIYV